MNTANNKLHNLTARRRLAARAKPYWVSVEPKLTLGYLSRPGQAGGAWIARREVGRKESCGASRYPYPLYEQWTLGAADDLVPADGVTILSYQQAMSKAATAHHTRKTGMTASMGTVAEAIEYYLDWLEKTKGTAPAEDARGKLRKHVLSTPLAERRLAALTHDDLERWKAAAVVTTKGPEQARRARDTWNRVRASFLAALNLAYAKKCVTTDEAWRDLKRFSKVAKARTHHFSLDEVRRLIAKATPSAFQHFLEAGFLTGARAGELRELDVKHFNAARGQLYVAGERTGARKTGPRFIPLTDEGVAFFAALAQGREPDAPLLVNPNGERWPIGGHKKPMKRALVAAGLYRKDARGNAPTFYATRYTLISRTRELGGPDWLIGKNCGTSPTMIESTYGKVTPEQQRALTAQFTPVLRKVDDAVA